MPFYRRPIITTLALAAAAALPSWTHAGTIRSDRDPQSYINLAASPSYAAAGKIEVTGNIPGFIGSGTLIGSKWVLTAAHLMDGANAASFEVGGQTYTADGWVAHPGWRGDARKGKDIALVRLSAPVNNVTPAGIYRTRDEFSQTGVFTGNGRTGTGDTGAIEFDDVPRAGTNVIDGMSVGKKKIYTTKLSKGSKIFVVDFDNPAQPGDNVVGSADATDLEFLIAQGDSGGAVFLPGPSGTPEVAGIHSYGEAPVGLDDSGYGDVTGHTRVSAYAKWIDKQIKRDRPTFLALPGYNDKPMFRSLSMADVDAGNVPEPTGLAAIAIGAVALLRRRRK